jgi:hypothetical protein
VIDRWTESGSRRAALSLMLAALLLLGACVETRPYATLSETAEPLRARFNQDVGHVRVMMLVAPT